MRLRATVAVLIMLTALVNRLIGDPIGIGAALPQVRGVTHEGREVDFAELGKEGMLLVYFYPKADTPGCTAQACSLRDAYESIAENGVTVVGVSRDDVAAQRMFALKYLLPFTLVADRDGKIGEAFGVPAVAGLHSRQAFLFRAGKVVWRDLAGTTGKQAQEVLKAVAALPPPDAAGAGASVASPTGAAGEPTTTASTGT